MHAGKSLSSCLRIAEKVTLRSDCVDGQADLQLLCPHNAYLPSRLIAYKNLIKFLKYCLMINIKRVTS